MILSRTYPRLQALQWPHDSLTAVEPQPAPTVARSSRDPDRIARYWRGQAAETLAVGLLMLQGYRILARRYRTPYGEIDIIARRGRRLAFVEVKARPTLEEAAWSLSATQAERIGRAAEHFMLRQRRYRDHEMGMDLVLIGRGCWPQHVRNAFHASWDAWKRK